MASCSLWSARATRRWQSSRSACRGGAPVNIRKPANATAASAVFPKSELFKRCRMGAPSFRTVFKDTHHAHSHKGMREREGHGTYINPYDGSFSLHLQRRGNRAVR